MKPTLIPVEPIGRERTRAFVCPGGLREVERDVFPPSPGEALRDTRIAFSLGLRETAKLLELTPVELSHLERGSATMSAEEWLAAWGALAAEWRSRNSCARAPGAQP